jgi:hypothetical protein
MLLFALELQNWRKRFLSPESGRCGSSLIYWMAVFLNGACFSAADAM